MQPRESHEPDISAPICSFKAQSKIWEEQRGKEELWDKKEIVRLFNDLWATCEHSSLPALIVWNRRPGASLNMWSGSDRYQSLKTSVWKQQGVYWTRLRWRYINWLIVRSMYNDYLSCGIVMPTRLVACVFSWSHWESQSGVQRTNTANQKDILLTRIQKIKSGLISSLCQTEHSNSYFHLLFPLAWKINLTNKPRASNAASTLLASDNDNKSRLQRNCGLGIAWC